MFTTTKNRSYKLEDAITEAKSNELYENHYIDGNELVVEIKGDICYVYNIDTKTWEKSEFVTDEDFEEIELELEIKKMRNYKYRRNKKKSENSITVMCDYCAEPLWYECEIPNSIKLIERRLFNWQNIYESFNFFNKNKIQVKVIENTSKYKKWIKEGYEIAKWVRKHTKSSIYVNYFNETNSKRTELSKRKIH